MLALLVTTCTYATSYSDPYVHGACFVDAVAGCPIHLVLPHTSTLPTPIVYRNGDAVMTTAMTTVAGSINPTISNIDYLSCDCHRDSGPMQFDELAVTLTGAQTGDDVLFPGNGDVTIGPAAPCQPPVWPTTFDVELGGCDLCPDDAAVGSDPAGSGSGQAPVPHGGCATSTPSGWVLVAFAFAHRRRRSHRGRM